MSDKVIVRMKHIRAADFCAGGARHWFHSHDLSWQDFLDNGISADILDATGDGLALAVTAIARSEVPHG